MSAGFASQLRAGRDTIDLGAGSGDALTVRVEVPETWDVARFRAAPATPVAELKRRAVELLVGESAHAEDFVVKHRGWEILDEGASLAASAIPDGGILLITNRKRRPVR